jgi:large subunit ribosomal protein L19
MNIDSLCNVKSNPNLPRISPGDTVKVSFKVKEATRERLQTFPGLVIKIRKGRGGGNFTVRRVTSGIGVEHTFPMASPLLNKVEVVRHGKVRRAKLYYMRELSAKEARLKERREKIDESAIAVEPAETAEEEKAPEAVVAPEQTTAETMEAPEAVAAAEPVETAEEEKAPDAVDITEQVAAETAEAPEAVAAAEPVEAAEEVKAPEAVDTSEQVDATEPASAPETEKD